MSLDIDYFSKLRADLKGMMPAEVYHELYLIARDHARSDIIDIGVGRGGTSIAFALGLKDAGKRHMVHAVDQFSQALPSGPHLYTSKIKGSVDLNAAEFTKNVTAHGACDQVKAWVGRTDIVGPTFPEIDADVLQIDVDGQIDRHMPYFYDRVREGGVIVLDDYGDFIDKRGRKYVETACTMSEADARAYFRKQDRRALGKHILTYEIAAEMERIGMIEQYKVITVTAFYRKSASKKFSEFDLSGLARVEQALEDRFVAECRKAGVA